MKNDFLLQYLKRSLPDAYGHYEQPQLHDEDVPILHDGHKQLRLDQDLDHYRRHPQVHPV